MSYTRRYSETIYKVVSKTVRYNYPASQNGGSDSVYVEIEAEIPVDVNIHVDTVPFDESVENCSTNVNLLTGAVVAAETAEVASKEINSKKIAETIISGFFSYVRSEISQQIAELAQNIDAQLMHLTELAQSCYAKKKQMEVDYNRIASRYMKISEDLNKELSNRIYELDRHTFGFKKETDKQKIRNSDNDLVNIVAVFGTESSNLQSKISSSITKKRALDSLNKAKSFLLKQKTLNTTIRKSMINESVSCSFLIPVVFIETIKDDKQVEKSTFTNDYFSVLKNKNQQNEIIEQFLSKSAKWGKLPLDDQKSMGLYFNTELNNKLSANDQHSVRVREMIQKIAAINSINAINY